MLSFIFAYVRFSEDADQNYVNQAQQLADGLKLVIPTMKETEETAGQEGTAGQIGIIGPPDPGSARMYLPD